MPKFSEIETFPHCGYKIALPWRHLEDKIQSEISEAGLDLNPDFQRGHVWTEAQQIAYVEYILRGGTSGRALYFNCKGWMDKFEGPYVIVDGKQRLEAVRRFMRNEVPAIGFTLSEYEDKPSFSEVYFEWNIAKLETRKEVLKWYLDFNSCGVVHTKEELRRVQKLIEAEG